MQNVKKEKKVKCKILKRILFILLSMNFDIVGIMGFIAGLLTTIAFLPQVIKVYRTKSTKDISLPMYVIFTIGVATWVVYGLMLNSMDVFIFNVITFILAIVILAYKLKLK